MTVAAAVRPRGHVARRRLTQSARYAVAIGVLLVVIVPVVYAVLGGFRTTGQISADPIGLPRPWVFDNYREILGSSTFWRQLRNSVLVAAVTMAVVIMLVHTYYGFTASGGPAGVGEAVGRAVRTSLISAVFVVLFLSLAIYGQSGNFHLSG